MSNAILILGESGSGKSTSIRNLNPKETFILNVINKPLPFKGNKKSYIKINDSGTEGNYYATDNWTKIYKLIDVINTKRPEIKNLIIDDFQYLMANEFMSRVLERGFDKFSEIAHHAWKFVNLIKDLRDDLNCFVLTHNESNDQGKMKIKTIGKLFDEKVKLEGMFTVIMQTNVKDNGYYFVTQSDARHIARSPLGMFDDHEIPNDLAYVAKAMNDYFNDGEAA